jgi:hypothetical protein
MVYDREAFYTTESAAFTGADVVTPASAAEIFRRVLGVTAGTAGLYHEHSAREVGTVAVVERREKPIVS